MQMTWSNGAGKTSLLRAVAGLLHVESGSILWHGRKIGADLRAYHADVAFFSHELALKGDLSADENLRYVAGLKRSSTAGERRDALERVGLRGLEGEATRRMSAGQQRRVALARMRLQSASLWLLDEPAAHLDAQGQQLVAQLVDEHVRAGGAALIATHQPLELARDSSGELSAPVGGAA